MINAVNANANGLYTVLGKQSAQTQNTWQAVKNTGKESRSAGIATPFPSRAQSSNSPSQPAFSSLLSMSNAGPAAESKLQAIANKYDVTNLSGNERIAMAQDLRDNQLIPNGAMMLIVAPLSMNENMNQKTDYLATARNSFDQAARMGSNNQQLELQRQRLEILELLDTLKRQ